MHSWFHIHHSALIDTLVVCSSTESIWRFFYYYYVVFFHASEVPHYIYWMIFDFAITIYECKGIQLCCVYEVCYLDKEPFVVLVDDLHSARPTLDKKSNKNFSSSSSSLSFYLFIFFIKLANKIVDITCR